MNQPQQLCVSYDFQGFLVCQIPKDVVKVELKIKTKWGKFTLQTDHHTRTGEVQALAEGQLPQNTYQEETIQPHDRT